MKCTHGSIIVITLLMLSVIMLLTQQLIKNVYIGSQLMQTTLDRQQAQAIAIGGINVAIAQINHTPSKESDKEKQLRAFLLRVLPHLNRWQTFDLHEAIDGLEGQLKICICAEDGKININEIFDFKKQEFKKEFESYLKNLEIQGAFKPGEIYEKLLEYFKKRQRKLDDITELSAIPGLNQLDAFYHPPQLPASKKEMAQPNSSVSFQDLFTTWTPNDKVNALWLSDSLCALLGFHRPLADDALHKQEEYKKITSDVKTDMAQDWETNWKILEPMYGNKPKQELMSALKNIFSKEFEPKVYSVLSYGKVGQAEQTLLAIIKLVKENEESETKSSDKPKEKFKILRLYWL